MVPSVYITLAGIHSSIAWIPAIPYFWRLANPRLALSVLSPTREITAHIFTKLSLTLCGSAEDECGRAGEAVRECIRLRLWVPRYFQPAGVLCAPYIQYQKYISWFIEVFTQRDSFEVNCGVFYLFTHCLLLQWMTTSSCTLSECLNLS